MPTRLVQVVIDAVNPPGLARFWADALGWEIAPEEPGEVVVQPEGFSYPAPERLPLVFVPVQDAKTAKNRVHLDLGTESAEDQAALVSRLIGLGATVADIGQHDVAWQVMADPEGNEFCVLDPQSHFAETGRFDSIVADVRDPESAARFWELAAGWQRVMSYGEAIVLRSPRGVGPFLELLRNPDTKTVKNRVHLDVAPEPGEDHDAAVRRLRDAGATQADIGQGDVRWVVLADPEGSEFCVLTPR